MPEIKLLAILIVGAIAGFIGAVAGGGGLISIPFLLFLGVPPQITLATNKFGGLGMSIGALFKFIKEKKIIWKYAVLLGVVGILGSIIGTRILLTINIDLLQKLIGILLIVLVPTVFFKKNFGLEEKPISVRRKIAGCVFYFFTAIISSFFGGMGIITISIVVLFFGLTMIKANATELFSFSVFSLFAVIIFAKNGLIDYWVGAAVFLGMLIGGYIGAHIAIKKGDRWVKFFFVLVVIASAIKILLS